MVEGHWGEMGVQEMKELLQFVWTVDVVGPTEPGWTTWIPDLSC